MVAAWFVAKSTCRICGAAIQVEVREEWAFNVLNGADHARCRDCIGKGNWVKV